MEVLFGDREPDLECSVLLTIWARQGLKVVRHFAIFASPSTVAERQSVRDYKGGVARETLQCSA